MLNWTNLLFVYTNQIRDVKSDTSYGLTYQTQGSDR